MLRKSDTVYVCIEYSPKENRVMVRGIFEMSDPMPKKIDVVNIQNKVGCFLGIDMGKNVGFRFTGEK